jgi:hypothetical protein
MPAVLLAGAMVAGQAIGAPTIVTVPALGDVALGRGDVHRNRGAEPTLDLHSSGHERLLVKMDPAAIRAAAAGGTLLSARLEMSIVVADQNLGRNPLHRDLDNDRGFAAQKGHRGDGTRLEVLPMNRAWVEGNGMSGSGATWTCAADGDIANRRGDCAAENAWELGRGENPWGGVSASVNVTGGQTGILSWDVTVDVAATLAGGEHFGWAVRKAHEGANGRVAFASREAGSNGPRLVIEVSPPAIGSWLNWNGATGATFPFAGNAFGDNATINLGNDRVLWMGWDNNFRPGVIRLHGVDRLDHSVSILAETSLGELLPDFMQDASSDWGDDRMLHRLVDGGVALFFWDHGRDGVVAITLDVDEQGIRVRGQPNFVPEAALLTVDGWFVNEPHRISIAPIGNDRFLMVYRTDSGRGSEAGFAQIDFFQQSIPASLTLSGQATLDGDTLVLTEAGSDSGAAVWAIDIVEGQGVQLTVNGSSDGGSLPVVIDRVGGFDAVDPIVAQPFRTFEDEALYGFLAPYTGKAYVKFRAPTLPAGSTRLNFAFLNPRDAEKVILREVNMQGGGMALGAPQEIPGDGANGVFLRMNYARVDMLEAGRYLLSAVTDSPESGVQHGISRVVTADGEGFAFGEWSEIVPTTMGPDYPFANAINGDSLLEGVFASVADDAMNREPLIATYRVANSSVEATGAQILSAHEGYFKNEVAYLGANEYLLAQEVDALNELGETVPFQHFYVFKTDGQGRIVDRAGPITQRGSLSAPRIERLDDDHLLVIWRSADVDAEGVFQERIEAKILYRH